MLRVVRGGSWNNEVHNVRCAVRNRNNPYNVNNNQGVRVVCATTLCTPPEMLSAGREA